MTAWGIAVDGDDAATEAVNLLLDAVPGSGSIAMTPLGYDELDACDVRVVCTIFPH
jgi:hypothetical protein